jgi:protein-S-isoprenylcysteine O-methyltransferase Ste14
MTAGRFQDLLGYLWGAMGIYWVWSARRRGKTNVGEANAFRFLRLSILVITFVLLLGTSIPLGPLDGHFLHENWTLRWIGFAFTALGIGLTILARNHLGVNWSDKVEIQENHVLIHTGPYAFFRHPIYSGVLTAIAGTAFAMGRWRCLIAFVLILTSYCIKAKKEERVLESAFGDEYRKYERGTGFLLPRFRRQV